MKILAIGNSFSEDATRYLYQIAASDGVKSKVVNLYIGGCSLETHWNNCVSGAESYLYELNGESTGKMVSIQDAIKSDDWDVITMQQASHFSTKYETYQPYINKLSALMKELAPKAEQVIHQTWSYEQDSQKLKNLGYQEQSDMFRDLKFSYDMAAKDLGGLRIIPGGDSFQLAIQKGIKPLHRDTFHASLGKGRYLLGAVWYEILFGKLIEYNSFTGFDEAVTQEEMALLKKCAHEAVSSYNIP